MTSRNGVLTLEVRKYRRLSSIPPLTDTVARLPDAATATKLAILESSVLTALTSYNCIKYVFIICMHGMSVFSISKNICIIFLRALSDVSSHAGNEIMLYGRFADVCRPIIMITWTSFGLETQAFYWP